MTNDVSRAYFYAPIKEGQYIYVKLPDEDILPGEEHMCGRLNFSMYGTRRAAATWEKHWQRVLVAAGFQIGVFSPALAYHPEKDAIVLVHGDDGMWFVAYPPSLHLLLVPHRVTHTDPFS